MATMIELVCTQCKCSYRRAAQMVNAGKTKYCSRACFDESRLVPVAERLETFGFPEPNSGCVLFTGHLNRDGYGCITVRSRVVSAHRAAYAVKHGAIKDGLQIDHLCRNRACINADHLEAVTARENWRRGSAPNAIAVRTGQCYRGHALDAANAYVWRGVRSCRACSREHIKGQER